jgi:hypothetical protein
MFKRKLALAGILLGFAGGAYASGTITTYSSRASFGSDVFVDWGGLGASFGPGPAIGTLFNNLQTSAPGVAVSGSSASLLARVDQGFNYFGNFAPGDRLLMTTAVAARGQIGKAPGPIRFTFPSGPVFGAGMQISTNVPGSFTTVLRIFNAAGVLLGSMTASGNSTSPAAGDNSAPFLGMRSTLAEIAAVEMDVPGQTGVAVNRMSIAVTAAVQAGSNGAAGTITTYTTAASYGGDAVVDWGGLGPTAGAQVLVGNFANLLSSAGGVAVSGSSPSDLARVDQGLNYLGNFAPGDNLLFTSGPAPRGGLPPQAPGPVRLAFAKPVFGAGLQVSTNVPGPFTATLKAFNAQGTLLGTVTAPGVSTTQSVGDNSAPFLGIRSSVEEIAAVEVDVPGATGVAVNAMKEGLNGSLLSIDSFFVSLLYRDLLNQPPDAAAVANLVGELKSGAATRPQIAQTFFLDPRFQTSGLAVAKAYLGALQLDPDFATWQTLTNLMNGGTSESSILGVLLATPQAQAIWGPAACAAGTAGCLTNAAFVNLLYQTLLGRAPDPAGLAYWNFLLNLGLSRTDTMLGFIQSPEYDSLMHTRAEVNLLYMAFLRRTGDAAGLNFWTVSLRFGVPLVSVIQGFISSPEYLARF